jgi:hypothetical protein
VEAVSVKRNPISTFMSGNAGVNAMEHHDLLAGLERLHVPLHHAAEHEICSQWMIDELAHHDYRLSPGTLYHAAFNGAQGLPNLP